MKNLENMGMRFCVGQTHTDNEHIKLAWESIKNGLKKIKE